MNIAERLQREAEKKRIQQEEQMKGGNKAIKEKYETEYQENKNKLSQEIKQDIKLISQQYPSFQKFALYKIYKQFDFNREISNEFISIQIQNQNQQDNEDDDWIEITSKRKTLIYKMSKSSENNQTPKRSQSVTNKNYSENNQQRQSRYDENYQRTQRRNTSGDRKREISPKKFNYLNRKYEKFDNDRNNIRQDGRRNQQVNYKPNTSYQNIYQPKYIYVPKYEDDECPYVPKQFITQTQNVNNHKQQDKNLNGNNENTEKSNQQSNMNQSEQDKIQQKLKDNQEALIQDKIKQDQLKQQQEQLRQEQIRQEQVRQEQIRQEQIRQEQLRQEQLKQEQIKQEQIRQEQIKLEQLKQEQIKLEQIRQEQLRLDQQQKMLKQPLQNNYQNQSHQQDLSQSQSITQQVPSSMFAPQFQIASQGFMQQNQEHQDNNNKPSVYDMLMSYINYE